MEEALDYVVRHAVARHTGDLFIICRIETYAPRYRWNGLIERSLIKS